MTAVFGILSHTSIPGVDGFTSRLSAMEVFGRKLHTSRSFEIWKSRRDNAIPPVYIAPRNAIGVTKSSGMERKCR